MVMAAITSTATVVIRACLEPGRGQGWRRRWSGLADNGPLYREGRIAGVPSLLVAAQAAAHTCNN